MKNLLTILFIISAFAASAQITGVPIAQLPTQIGKPANGWMPISIGGVTKKLDINSVAGNKLDTFYVHNDTLFGAKAGVVFYNIIPKNALTKVNDSIYLFGSDSLIIHSTGGSSGTTLSQNVKDTTVTFSGTTTFTDIPSGITYTPGFIDVTLTSATSSAGDTGQGFTYLFNTTTHVLKIQYGVAPIGTFTYHIVFTKTS